MMWMWVRMKEEEEDREGGERGEGRGEGDRWGGGGRGGEWGRGTWPSWPSGSHLVVLEASMAKSYFITCHGSLVVWGHNDSQPL